MIPLIPVVLSILAPVAMSTSEIEDAVNSVLTCMGVEQKSYECLLDYNVEGYLFVFHVRFAYLEKLNYIACFTSVTYSFAQYSTQH